MKANKETEKKVLAFNFRKFLVCSFPPVYEWKIIFKGGFKSFLFKISLNVLKVSFYALKEWTEIVLFN